MKLYIQICVTNILTSSKRFVWWIYICIWHPCGFWTRYHCQS
eukprot:UN14423